MGMKLRIGDKIIWDDLGNSPVFTILDIDTTRPPSNDSNGVFVSYKQVLFKWEQDGKTHVKWCCVYDTLNKLLNNGGISIVNRIDCFRKELKKFTL
jgi:hypothetical protein